ncbi:hypothetical protein CFP56_021412 [Quercus suber]|uniref:Uncharacterized protein n=1 Tax=Quercus suber TaxID=58331 RepID=A0AAW0KE19_QUESU
MDLYNAWLPPPLAVERKSQELLPVQFPKNRVKSIAFLLNILAYIKGLWVVSSKPVVLKSCVRS